MGIVTRNSGELLAAKSRRSTVSREDDPVPCGYSDGKCHHDLLFAATAALPATTIMILSTLTQGEWEVIQGLWVIKQHPCDGASPDPSSKLGPINALCYRFCDLLDVALSTMDLWRAAC